MSLANLKYAVLSTSLLTALSFSPLIDAGSCCHTQHECCDNHQKVAGSYFVCGFDPYLNSKYEGTLIVTQLCCNVYTFHWTYVDGHIETGTGIFDKKTNVIAANFTKAADATYTGVELFRVTERGVVSGRWVLTGQCPEGKETLVKIRC